MAVLKKIRLWVDPAVDNNGRIGEEADAAEAVDGETGEEADAVEAVNGETGEEADAVDGKTGEAADEADAAGGETGEAADEVDAVGGKTGEAVEEADAVGGITGEAVDAFNGETGEAAEAFNGETGETAQVGRPVYARIGDALKAAEGMPGVPCEIVIVPGIYNERLSITRPYLTLTGTGEGEVVISGSLGGYEILEDGLKRGTFRTQTVFLHTHDVTLKDLTIENTAGPGKKAGQAIALYADGDRLVFERVVLKGWQDTLFCGPLPPTEREPGGFRGPLEHAPRINGRQYYRDCTILGNIDFIFGSATAYFDHCRIEVLDPGTLSPGAYITASSTAEGQAYGFVFSECRVESTGLPGRIFLGRPWREYAKAVFIHCDLDAQVAAEGWEDWGRPHEDLFLAEYESRGPGADPQDRAGFSRQLSGQEAALYSKEQVLGGDAWWDTEVI